MKTIKVNNVRFALPDTMSTKDIQALVGFLATLQTVETHYDYTSSEYLYGLGDHPEVQVQETRLTEDARAKSEASYEQYKAKREAEKAADV